MPRILLVTGKLAEPALRRVLDELAPITKLEFEIAVMPITVAALLTTDWVARRLVIPSGIDRVILPGFCRGELSDLKLDASVMVERGPKDLRDLPEFFGNRRSAPQKLDTYSIEIIAEINHAPTLTNAEILRIAEHYRRSGADVIDLGCDPGSTWVGVGNAVRQLRSLGHRVSVDSFNSEEIEQAITAGAELVLSVNGTNRHKVQQWKECAPSVEVVAIPDIPSDLASLDRTVEELRKHDVRFRLDPILEPIGFGFVESLQRYAEVRRRYPDAPMMMGIGNVTELTDVDSAGANVLLAAICEEWKIGSVLTTEVIPWCQSAVREFDLARRLVHHAIRERVLPKHLEPRLVTLRDPKQYELGEARLAELADQVKDRNFRLFAERGEIHTINGKGHLHGDDPFELFRQMLAQNPEIDPSHAFYLGYEMAKAVTALTLGKNYTQDQALRWGFLTREEESGHGCSDHQRGE